MALAMRRCRGGGGDGGGGEKGKACPAAALVRSLGVQPGGGHWPDRVLCDEVGCWHDLAV